jgi:archaemetzincin
MFRSIQRGIERLGLGAAPSRVVSEAESSRTPPDAGTAVEPAPVPCREGPRRVRLVELVPVTAPLLPEQPVPLALLEELGVTLGAMFRVACKLNTRVLDARIARNGRRNQYLSTSILEALSHLPHDPGTRILGVTALDLYVPILTYVFGEAQLEGDCALVSLHRLHEEFYGLPPDLPLLKLRLLKEAVHELGHTCGLRHCMNWECVMASTHTAERLDVKSARFCSECLRPPGPA